MSGGIRPAEPRDAAGIRSVHLAAFPTAAEADLVEALARDGDTVVSLVGEVGGDLAGHVVLSRMRATGEDRAWRALGLGPVGVRPGFQGAGIGRRLIEAALAIAQATGEDLVFVLGAPDYYCRFGFSAETAAPFASPYAGPCFMARALAADWVSPAKGEATYAPAFAAFE